MPYVPKLCGTIATQVGVYQTNYMKSKVDKEEQNVKEQNVYDCILLVPSRNVHPMGLVSTTWIKARGILIPKRYKRVSDPMLTR